MRVLLVATNAANSDKTDEISRGEHPRIEYLELARRLGADFVEYSDREARGGPLRRVEETLRADLRLAAHVARKTRSQHYDVVVSLSERVGIPLAHLLPRDVCHIALLHHPLSRNKLRLTRTLRVPARWDLCTVLSRAEASVLRNKYHQRRDAIKVLHTPVDTAFYRPQLLDAARAAAPHVLSLGLSYRDYPTLLRAMRRLPEIACHIRAGSSWVKHKAGYESEAIPPNVSLLPFVHPQQLRTLVADSRFAVVPIRPTTQWAAGCTSIQLVQACGRPVIATRLPGLEDYVLDGETGLLVAPGDELEMAAAIEQLWKDPQRTRKMGERAREWVTATFSMEWWLDTICEMITTLPRVSAPRRLNT